MPRDLAFDIRARDKTGEAFDSASRNAKGFMGQIEAMRRHMDVAATAAKAFAAGIVVDGMGQLVEQTRQVVEEFANIQDLADKIGMSAESVQRFQFGLSQAGIAAEDVDGILTQWSKRIGEAFTKGGQLADVLKANGVSLTRSNGSLRDGVDLMGDFAELVRNAGSDQERLVLATLGFGKSGAAMASALRDGRDGLQGILHEADKAGGVIEDSLVARAAELDDKFNVVSRTISMQMKSNLLSVVDALDKIAEHRIFGMDWTPTAVQDRVDNFNDVGRKQIDLADLESKRSGIIAGIRSKNEEFNTADVWGDRSGIEADLAARRKELGEVERQIADLKSRIAVARNLQVDGDSSAWNRPALNIGAGHTILDGVTIEGGTSWEDRAQQAFESNRVDTGIGMGDARGDFAEDVAAANKKAADEAERERKERERLGAPMRDLWKSAQDRIDQIELETKLLGMTGAQAEALRMKQDMLSRAMEDGKQVTADQVAEIERLANAYGKAASAMEIAQQRADLRFEGQQMNRSSREQGIYDRFRGTGIDPNGPEGDYMRRMDLVSQQRGIGTDLLRAIKDGVMEGGEDVGAAVMKKIADAMLRQADDALNDLIDSFVSSIFKMPELSASATASMSVTAGVVNIGGAGALPFASAPGNMGAMGGIGGAASLIPGIGAAGQTGRATSLTNGIQQSAAALGISPRDLAAAISYETGGTFDPLKRGPTTQWGQHRGLIQFGEPQARQFGVDWSDPIGSQLGAEGAVVKYLRGAGVKPGMGMMDVYSAINAGRVGRYNASDAGNGGAWGTVADKVNHQMAGHYANADKLLGSAGSASAALDKLATGGTAAADASMSAAHNFMGAGQAVGQAATGLTGIAQQLFNAGGIATGQGSGNWFSGLMSMFGGAGGAFAHMNGISPLATRAIAGGAVGLFANGTDAAPAGWAWVGEEGPELMKMRGGEVVRSYQRSREMVAGSGGGRPAFSPTYQIDARGSNMTPAQFERIADQRARAALAEYHDNQTNGGFGEQQKRYASQKG